MAPQPKESVTTIEDTSRKDHQEGADFEAAILATGFGKFNFFLYAMVIPGIFTVHFETSALSFVFPAAQCDLNLSMEDKGLVNAVIFGGMISSCFLWGSIADIYGRKKTLVIVHVLISIFVLMTPFSQNLAMLMSAKFLGGFCINGQTMAIVPFLSEFHGKAHRSKIPLITGFLFGFGGVCLPLLAWTILPLDIQFSFYEDGFEFHPWNVFLFICAIPAFVSTVNYLFLPETPKFLMSKGRNKEALRIFRHIYSWNTGLPMDKYPITRLVEEIEPKSEPKEIKKRNMCKEGWDQISPLFSLKYAPRLLLVCFLQFALMFCVNSLRLWLPQIFQTINDYEFYQKESAPICTMLEFGNNTQGSNADDDNCAMNVNNSWVYINTAVVAACQMMGYLSAGTVINKVGKKPLAAILGLVSSTAIISTYFAPNSTVALILICVFMTSAAVSYDVVIAVTVDSFPTTLRASALSLAFMSARLASVIGNIVFPILLQLGCGQPFFSFGAIYICFTVFTFLLPNTEFKSLQ